MANIKTERTNQQENMRLIKELSYEIHEKDIVPCYWANADCFHFLLLGAEQNERASAGAGES